MAGKPITPLNQQKNDFESRARQHIKAKSSRVSQEYMTAQTKIMEEAIFPAIGHFDLAAITSQQIESALRSVEERHGMQLARQICTLCADVFTKGIVAGVCVWNPAIAARDALSPRHRTNNAMALNPDRFTSLISKIGRYSASPVIGAALRLSVHLLVQRGELCSAQWNDLNWDEAIWRYELSVPVDARGRWRSHYVPLFTQAVRIFRDLQLITGGTRWAFTVPQLPDNPIRPQVLRRALRSMETGRDIASSDAFRARAKNLLLEDLHIPPQIVNQQLGHAMKDRRVRFQLPIVSARTAPNDAEVVGLG